MDIICFSHLRWNFVYQRPQQLLSRMTKRFRVFYIEEPIFDSDTAFLENYENDDAVWILVAHLPSQISRVDSLAIQNKLLDDFFLNVDCTRFIAWYYTPMALDLNIAMTPELIVYDCMDELSAFKYAPPELKDREADLLKIADIVFTGGHSLFEARKHSHKNIHLFPSSIDEKHFKKARVMQPDPSTQLNIPHPRIGFFGVVDERMNIQLLSAIAEQKPDWHFILIGPVVKVDPLTLPQRHNIHYLGVKDYKVLPRYISHWDVAMIPFGINEHTRFISPTKTPEYLAAGKPVVSTPIQDVVTIYGAPGLVFIAASPDEFISSIQKALNMNERRKWLETVDELLAQNSWNKTVDHMMFHINIALHDHAKKTLIAHD